MSASGRENSEPVVDFSTKLILHPIRLDLYKRARELRINLMHFGDNQSVEEIYQTLMEFESAREEVLDKAANGQT